MRQTLTAFQKWCYALEVPRLGWPALHEPSEAELRARAETLTSASGRKELCDVAVAQLLVHLGVLDYLREC